jgi:hypothetical protein
MKSFVKLFLFVLICVMIVPALGAQVSGAQVPGETILQSYERLFIRSGLSTKVNVLSDAANDEAAADFYGPLCALALDFVTANGRLFRDDADMVNIAVAAVRGVGKYAYLPATDTVWQIFLRFPDNIIRYEILEVLPVLDTYSLTEKVNGFIAEQNRQYSAGLIPDSRILVPLFDLLGDTGDESSYPVLFAASRLYSGEVREEAAKALYRIEGDFFGFCIKMILDNPPLEKLEAFKAALSWEGLSSEQKGVLAETSLETALSLPGVMRSETRELIEAALGLVKETQWVRALPQVLKYYNQSLAAFRSDVSQKRFLLNSIDCLGALKSAEAAEVLALQLGLYNSRAPSLEEDEQEVVLALIQALGRLGYKASYDSIHYASLLPYPEEIKGEARNALVMLKW